jgi:phosphonate degradation associated HDIG domain protein
MTLTLDAIFSAFERCGARNYGERVTQLEHMLQSAELAVADGAGDALIAAALLHDIGHFEEPEPEDGAAPEIDLAHEVRAARSLATLFAPDVWRPVALHVAAKRYLCAVEPGYLESLSPASLASLKVQGGTFTHGQVERFIALPYAQDALRLRRYDDGAKRPGHRSPPLTDYQPLLERLAADAPRQAGDPEMGDI